ncbi:MAG: SHOCT domain-containing protein [Actinomycetota bacterium]|nr:SHOCT domain-containing protein [Actinomycetota bacterium]
MSALLLPLALGGFDYGHMGMGMGNGWGWLALVAMATMMGGMGWMMWSMMRRTGSNGRGSPEDPVEVLKARYAHGELTTEEFHERLHTIEDARR